MDGNITLIIIAVIFAVVVLAWALLFRKKGKASIEAGPVKMSVEGESPEARDTDKAEGDAPAPVSGQAAESRDTVGGVSIEDARAGGGILAEASDGGGVTMKKVEAGDDIIASASKQGDSPKA